MLGKVGDALLEDANALRLRGQRQGVLAANIANADTPNYKAQDFDFAQAINAASKKLTPTAANTLSATHAKHMSSSNAGVGSLPMHLQFRESSQPSLDGNTVDMDVERTQFADNALRYEAALRNLNGTVKSIQSALQISG